MCGRTTIQPIAVNLGVVEQLTNVIIPSKFGEDRSSSLNSVGSRISLISIDLLSGHYNIASTAVLLVIIDKYVGRVHENR